MPKKRRTGVWLWLFVLGYLTPMTITQAIKAVTDSNVSLRVLAISVLVVEAFVAGTVFGFLRGQQKLSARSTKSAP